MTPHTQLAHHSRGAVQGKCDFCGNAGPLPLSFPCPDIVRHPAGDNRATLIYRGAWAACAVCAVLVQREAWPKLLRRIWRTYSRQHGPLPERVTLVVQAEIRSLVATLAVRLDTTPIRRAS